MTVINSSFQGPFIISTFEIMGLKTRETGCLPFRHRQPVVPRLGLVSKIQDW